MIIIAIRPKYDWNEEFKPPVMFGSGKSRYLAETIDKATEKVKEYMWDSHIKEILIKKEERGAK